MEMVGRTDCGGGPAMGKRGVISSIFVILGLRCLYTVLRKGRNLRVSEALVQVVVRTIANQHRASPERVGWEE